MIYLQKQNRCKEFNLNGTLYATCEGTYFITEQQCAGYPVYKKPDNSKYIYFGYDGRWYCAQSMPVRCILSGASFSPKRDVIEGVWRANDDSWVNCLKR